MEYYSNYRKEGKSDPRYTGMNPEDFLLSEIKDRYYKYCISPVIWGIQNSQIHRDRKWKDSHQGLRGGGMGSHYVMGTEFQLEKIPLPSNVYVLNARELEL